VGVSRACTRGELLELTRGTSDFRQRGLTLLVRYGPVIGLPVNRGESGRLLKKELSIAVVEPRKLIVCFFLKQFGRFVQVIRIEVGLRG